MKKKLLKTSLFILFVGLFIGINSFTYINKSKVINNIKRQGPPDKWKLFKCVVEENGTNYYGTKCEVAVWEDCPKAVSCKKLLDDNGDPMPFSSTSQLHRWGFSDDDINIWQEIEEPFQSSTDYINNHYLFYIATYNQGITFHPDEIIKRNQ